MIGIGAEVKRASAPKALEIMNDDVWNLGLEHIL